MYDLVYLHQELDAGLVAKQPAPLEIGLRIAIQRRFSQFRVSGKRRIHPSKGGLKWFTLLFLLSQHSVLAPGLDRAVGRLPTQGC